MKNYLVSCGLILAFFLTGNQQVALAEFDVVGLGYLADHDTLFVRSQDPDSGDSEIQWYKGAELCHSTSGVGCTVKLVENQAFYVVVKLSKDLPQECSFEFITLDINFRVIDKRKYTTEISDFVDAESEFRVDSLQDGSMIVQESRDSCSQLFVFRPDFSDFRIIKQIGNDALASVTEADLAKLDNAAVKRFNTIGESEIYARNFLEHCRFTGDYSSFICDYRNETSESISENGVLIDYITLDCALPRSGYYGPSLFPELCLPFVPVSISNGYSEPISKLSFDSKRVQMWYTVSAMMLPQETNSLLELQCELQVANHARDKSPPPNFRVFSRSKNESVEGGVKLRQYCFENNSWFNSVVDTYASDGKFEMLICLSQTTEEFPPKRYDRYVYCRVGPAGNMEISHVFDSPNERKIRLAGHGSVLQVDDADQWNFYCHTNGTWKKVSIAKRR